MTVGLLSFASLAAGKVQAGITSMFGSIDIPFIDITRIAGSTWQAFLSPTQDPYQFLNADGYPNAMPSGAFEWRILLDGLLQDPADGFSGRWILDWTGGPATLDAVFSGTNVTQSTFSSSITGSSGRIVFTVTSSSLAPLSAINVQLNITAVTGQITKVRCYPARYETLLNSGQQWDPDFINFYKVWGRVRFMDWIQTNGNTQVLWASRTTPTQFSQRGFNINTPFYCGQSSKVKNTLTTVNAPSGNPSSWTHGQMVQTYIPVASLPACVDFQSATTGATTTINATAHGFSNGDQVQFANGSFPSGGAATTDAASHVVHGAPVFTVASATANTFVLSGVNSTAWTNTGGGGQVFNVFQVTAGLLSAKPVSGLDGNSIFVPGSGFVISNNAVVGQFVYDSDFDRLMYSPGPDGTGNGVANGISIETLVDLANNLGPLVQPWFCIPNMVDDAYVTNWATYIRDNLNPAIKFCVEYSNEVWNIAAGFIQTAWCNNKGALKWSVSPSLDAEYQYYGFRARAVMVLIESVFSGQMNRVNRVFGNHVTDVTSVPEVIHRHTCPNAGFLAGDYPINHMDSSCIANYYNMSNDPLVASDVHDINYGNPTQIATGLAYLDNKFRTDSTGSGSLSYLSGQWSQWATYWATFTSNISGKTIQPTSYEGGFNAFPLYSLTGSYSPPVTISSGTYDTTTGIVVLTTTPAMPQASNGDSITISSLTGTGSFASLNGTYGIANDQHSSTNPNTGTIYLNGTSGLGSITITGGALIDTKADILNALFVYWGSSTYAQFLTDASNANIAAGFNFPAQFCVVAGAWASLSPFSLKQPNRLAVDTPPYLAWRALNGR